MNYWPRSYWPASYWPRSYWPGLGAAAATFVRVADAVQRLARTASSRPAQEAVTGATAQATIVREAQHGVERQDQP